LVGLFSHKSIDKTVFENKYEFGICTNGKANYNLTVNGEKVNSIIPVGDGKLLSGEIFQLKKGKNQILLEIVPIKNGDNKVTISYHLLGYSKTLGDKYVENDENFVIATSKKPGETVDFKEIILNGKKQIIAIDFDAK